jgi:hypothetical protein
LVWTGDGRAEEGKIERVISKAGADYVRIECAISAPEDSGEVELTGSITHTQSKHVLWKGSLGHTKAGTGAAATLSQTISRLKPELWSPNQPTLYNLTVTLVKEGRRVSEQTVRFGFRSFETKHGQFYLNGRPIFLRGLAINPPGRTVPEETGESRKFVEDYVRFLKSKNVNTIRMTHDSQVWFDVCDELGMMVYQGQYGSPLAATPRKQAVPTDLNASVAEYKKLFETYVRHPSILIYILANELPTAGARGKAFHDYLTKVCAELKPWDPTRLIIGNAGYGEGREGDICDVHRYWGWYYNTFLTYYNLRDRKLFGDPAREQPVTFTECVGNFTGPLGEYNIIVRKQLGAQLNWTGHSANQREDALDYQAFMTQQAAETFRRLRPLNPRLSGLMPFTILFYNWSGITNFSQMKAKSAMDGLAAAYQPVLLSWELWTPQVYAGSVIRPVAHIINDSEDGKALMNATLQCQLRTREGKMVLRLQPVKLPTVPYYKSWSSRLQLDIPEEMATGDYTLSGLVMAGGRVISRNDCKVFIGSRRWSLEPRGSPEQEIHLYDPSGQTAEALRKLQLPFHRVSNLRNGFPTSGMLVLGEDALSGRASPAFAKLKGFVGVGGRILCLKQDPAKFDSSWLPEPITFFTASANATTYPPASRPFNGNMNINPERPDHPVFDWLDRHRLALWSDYTNWEQTRPGFPKVYPVTAGFKLTQAESLERTAILADYDRGLEGVGLCEMFDGRGSVIVSGFDLVKRAGVDPVADRFLLNLVRYAASTKNHEPHALIDQPIEWGNYASERGVVAGSLNGLVVNATWVRPLTNPSAQPLTQAEGAWNTRPGDQFVPHGRSPLGPFSYSTGSTLRDLQPEAESGTGFFCARIPAGRTRMTTLVQNPSEQPGELSVSVNDGPAIKAEIPAGKTITVTAPLREQTMEVKVKYTGAKKLVLLRTAFE